LKKRRVGELRFYPDAEPYNNLYNNKGEITLVFDINHFINIIEMIRNEKPLYLGLDTESGDGFITTDLNEPIKEEQEF
jgi:glucosamine 6-phosphate synthetase-like amidotransferase/phosphosugar isomerase protein